MSKIALVMAGGTGGHIFPGLAVAEALRLQGWQVHWVGGPNSMESRLVPPRGFAFQMIDFSGVRGKGIYTLTVLPLRLLKAFWQSIQVIRSVKPHVVLGFGGYITFPAGLMAVLLGKSLILHEQNSIAGLANKVLARLATKVFTAFPGVLSKGEWVGNPLRTEFMQQVNPFDRFASRQADTQHRLRVLVLGGSLGAQALNDIVPKAIALLPVAQRPEVIHQSGEKQIETLRSNYALVGVEATLTPFINDTAAAFAHADLVVCRAGASTVTEIAAVGAAALFVPFPFAVDDHQTTNAQYLSSVGAAQLIQQKDLTPAILSSLLQKAELTTLLNIALKAKSMQKTSAVEAIVQACKNLSKNSNKKNQGDVL